MPVISSTDIDPDYNALVEDDSGAGGDFPWEHAATDTHVLDHVLKPPTHGGGGGGGGSTVATQALVHADGPTFDTNATVNGSYFIPPDSTSAAGTAAILAGVNGVVQEFDRGGTDGNTLTSHPGFALDAVFKGAAGFLGDAFDPHILYDPNTDRFIVVAVDQNASNHTSQLLIAVSNNGAPHGTADFTAVSVDATQAVSGGGSWADFPQVGLDHSGNIYLTANMFAFSGGSYTGTRLWVENEGSLTSTVTAHDVAGESGAGANDFFSAAPTDMPSADGNFLISYNSATNSAGHNVLHVTHIATDGTIGPEQTIDLGSKFDASATFGGISAPQPGTSRTLDADDSRTSMAVLGNHLYVAATTVPTSGADAGHATVHWWGLNYDNTTGLVSLFDQGTVSGNGFVAGSNLRTFYPSIAVTSVNGHDEVAIDFSTSAPQTGTGYDGFPSAYEVTFDPTIGVGSHAWQELAGGVANYYRTFGGTDNRWGDYSSISADPLHPGQFWAFNQFAESQGTSLMGQTGRWATELGLFS